MDETKPFQIQAPQQIATEYGGNKQKIAAAAQMGLIDPTAAVLAGMFIDRMRSAAQSEQGPQQTVAQQVFNSQRPAPPPGPLTANPPPAPAGVPPQGAAPPQGGLPSIPTSDAMAPQPGYGGGGLVAFAAGGTSGINLMDPQLLAESGGNQFATSPKGAYGLMQLMPGTQSDPGFGVAPLQNGSPQENVRLGKDYLAAMQRKFKDPALALMAYNWGPGNVQHWLATGADPAKVPAETKAYVAKLAGGLPSSVGAPAPMSVPTPPAMPPVKSAWTGDPTNQQGVEANYDKLLGPQQTSGLDALRTQLQGVPGQEAKQKKQDMWQALAQLGFGMASSRSPYFLQAVGDAANSTLPGIRSANDARKKAQMDALQGLAQLDQTQNAQARQRAGDITSETTAVANRAQQAAQLQMEGQRVAAEMAMRGAEKNATLGATYAEIASREKEDELQRRNAMQIAQLQAGKTTPAEQVYNGYHTDIMSRNAQLPTLANALKDGTLDSAAERLGASRKAVYDAAVAAAKASGRTPPAPPKPVTAKSLYSDFAGGRMSLQDIQAAGLTPMTLVEGGQLGQQYIPPVISAFQVPPSRIGVLANQAVQRATLMPKTEATIQTNAAKAAANAAAYSGVNPGIPAAPAPTTVPQYNLTQPPAAAPTSHFVFDPQSGQLVPSTAP